MKTTLIPFFILAVGSLLATNPAKEFQMGNQFAANLLDAGSAVKVDEILGAPNANPPEAGYREAELENKAQGTIKKGSASGMIVESSKSRERYKIDSSTDPIIQTSNQIAANPLNVIGGKDTKIVKINTPRKTRTVTCEEAGDPSQEICKGKLHITLLKGFEEKEKNLQINIQSVSLGSNGVDRSDIAVHKTRWVGQGCNALQIALWELSSHWAWKASQKTQFAKIQNPDLKRSPDITGEYKACLSELKSQGGEKSTYAWKGAGVVPVSYGIGEWINPSHIVSVNLSPNASKNFFVVTGNAPYQIRSGLFQPLTNISLKPVLTIRYKAPKYDIQEEWIWACDDLEKRADQGLCTYEDDNCTVEHQTRWIDGVQINRPCWEKTRTYLCAYPAKNDCGPLRAQGCYQTKSTCKKWVGKTCVVHTQTYQCDAGKNTGSIEAIQGGEAPFCLDGNCTNQSWDSNDEMGNAMAQLSLLKQLQDDFKNDKVSLFKGDDNRCKKEALGFKDCCKDNGWGQSMSLTSCSGEERLLAEKKSKKLCHFVGTYCDKKILGKCVSKKSTYCCYGTKLSRIFHEQGRTQIGLGWGDAQNPVCRGFTIEEIQKIDFSKLDLHEVFEEIIRNYSAPNLGVMKKQIEHRMQDIQNSIKPTKNLKNLPPQRGEA